MTLVIAHRGAAAYEYENSLAAFRRAVALGADGIELDVHQTADGALVVVHDADLDGRPITQLSLDETRTVRLPNGERIPTLDEALATIGGDTLVFIEVKGLAERGDRQLFASIDGAPRPDHCQVHAFDHRIVRRLCRARPGLRGGVLSTSYPLDPAAQVTAAGAAALWQHKDLVDVPLAAIVHDAGYALYAWTVDDPTDMRSLLSIPVDGICTNRPDTAREVIG
ncbi:MAG TPA: glycerophosphodiester phosphodiesterase [Gemmatimonadales bacterium]